MNKAHDTDPALISTPTPIRTERLVIRPHEAGDGKMLAKATLETWDDLYQWFHLYMGPKNKETDPEFKETWAQSCAADFAARKDLRFIILDASSNTFVGVAGLINPDWRIRRFELDYWITKTAQGKGYATEAAHALLHYAFKALNARVVTVGHAEGNTASKRVIEKLGFQHISRKPSDYKMPNGTLVDSHDYHRENADDLPETKILWD